MTQKVNKPLINKNMTVLDIVSRYRGTETVFNAYNTEAGVCICCQALFDNLGDVSTRYNLDLEQFLTDLESVIASHADDIAPEKELL